MPSLSSLPVSITSLYAGLGPVLPVLGEFDFPDCVAGAIAECEDIELFARDGNAAVKDKFFIPGVVASCGLLVIAIICCMRLGCNWKRRSSKPYNTTAISNVYASGTQKRTSHSTGSVLSNAQGRPTSNGYPNNPAPVHLNNTAPKPSPYINLDRMAPPSQPAYDGRSVAPQSQPYDGRLPSQPQQEYGYTSTPYNNIQTLPPAHSGFHPTQQGAQMSVNRTAMSAQNPVHIGYALSDGSTRIASDGADSLMDGSPVVPGTTPYFTPPLGPSTPAANRDTTYTDRSDDFGQPPARQAYTNAGGASHYLPPQYADGTSAYDTSQYPQEKRGW